MDPYVPMPMTEHPHYASRADGIRALVNERRMAITVAEAQPTMVRFDRHEQSEEIAIKRVVMDVKKIAGPAPFVGDPRLWQGWYFWYAAVDSAGRHVAGDATLSITPRY